MDIYEIKETVISWDGLLSERMKKYIHYRSIRNFVLHFDEIKSEKARERICSLLTDYIEEVREKDYDLSGKGESLALARKYLSTIGEYYREYSNFMSVLEIKFVLIGGILGDAILFFTGLSSEIFHLPIVTIVLLLYYFFIMIFKEPKGRVYGIFY